MSRGHREIEGHKKTRLLENTEEAILQKPKLADAIPAIQAVTNTTSLTP